MTLSATADAGYTFDGWIGSNCPITDNPGTVTMNADRACTALFTLNTYKLTVSSTGTGTGTITDSASPHQIDCGGACSGTYPTGTQITLHAVPAGSSTFNRWSGACSGTNATTQVTIGSTNITCTAQFDAPNTLNVTVTGSSGSGSVKANPGAINCGAGNTGTCSDSYANGTSVVLTATASSGNSFGGWGNDCGSASNTSSSLTTTVQMTQAHTCTVSIRRPVP